MAKKLVCGVGNYDSSKTRIMLDDGSVARCPFYAKWNSMIRRCYSESYRKTHSSYVGYTVCTEWLTFSNFKEWMQFQDWQGKDLDKDLLLSGNMEYSPLTCCFIPRMVNCFITDSKASRGRLKIGVTSDRGKFKACCMNPFTGKNHNLGRFVSEEDAHLAWKKRKHQFALELAKTQSDVRVIFALENRYK